MGDILDDLEDLHKQATEERSHNYTGRCIRRAIDEIKRLRHQKVFLLEKIKALKEPQPVSE